MYYNEIPTLIQKLSVPKFSSEHTTHCASVHWKCNNIWDVSKCHTYYTAIFYFSLNKVDSASAAAVASILSPTSSFGNNSFQIFLTSPICHVSEFCLETGGQEGATVVCTTGLDCGDVLAGYELMAILQT